MNVPLRLLLKRQLPEPPGGGGGGYNILARMTRLAQSLGNEPPGLVVNSSYSLLRITVILSGRARDLNQFAGCFRALRHVRQFGPHLVSGIQPSHQEEIYPLITSTVASLNHRKAWNILAGNQITCNHCTVFVRETVTAVTLSYPAAL